MKTQAKVDCFNLNFFVILTETSLSYIKAERLVTETN